MDNYIYMVNMDIQLRISGYISAWWLSPTPLKNDGVRQLG